MPKTEKALFPAVRDYIEQLDVGTIPLDRQEYLKAIAQYISKRAADHHIPRLHFICTHNSRRSQFGQVWCRVMAAHFGISVATFSGGTEVTAVHPQVISALEHSGLKIQSSGEKNAVHRVAYSINAKPISLFSKLYDHPDNPREGFAAVMTCSHADTNCPFIPGAEKRYALHYPDPKSADGTATEAEAYARCNRQIAAEMLFLFRAL